MSIKFLVLGGGYLGFFLGGGECRSYFYGRGDFSDLNTENLFGLFLGDNLHRLKYPENRRKKKRPENCHISLVFTVHFLRFFQITRKVKITF